MLSIYSFTVDCIAHTVPIHIEKNYAFNIVYLSLTIKSRLCRNKL